MTHNAMYDLASCGGYEVPDCAVEQLQETSSLRGEPGAIKIACKAFNLAVARSDKSVTVVTLPIIVFSYSRNQSVLQMVHMNAFIFAWTFRRFFSRV